MTYHYNTLPCQKTRMKQDSARTQQQQALAHRNPKAVQLVQFHHTDTKDLILQQTHRTRRRRQQPHTIHIHVLPPWSPMQQVLLVQCLAKEDQTQKEGFHHRLAISAIRATWGEPHYSGLFKCERILLVMLQAQGQAILTVKRGCVLSLWKKIEAIIEGKISLTLKSLVRASLVKHWTWDYVKGDATLSNLFLIQYITVKEINFYA